MANLKRWVWVVLIAIVPTAAVSAGDEQWHEYLKTYATAVGCYNFIRTMAQQVDGNIAQPKDYQLDSQLLEKLTLKWSDDDLDAAMSVYRDCWVTVGRQHAPWLGLWSPEKIEPLLRAIIRDAREADSARRAQIEAQRNLEVAKARIARQKADEEARRKQQQLEEQAERDREVAEEAQRTAEREQRTVELTKKVEEAQRARQQAEQKLADVREQNKALEKAHEEALKKARAADDTRTQELQRLAALGEQARLDKEAAEEAQRVAEGGDQRIAEAAQQAQEALVARREAEKKLAEIRGRLDSLRNARDQARDKAGAADKTRAELEEELRLSGKCEVSLEQFNNATYGMSLRDIERLFGCKGTEVSGIRYGYSVVATYSWKGNTEPSLITMTFQDSALQSKMQFGLERVPASE